MDYIILGGVAIVALAMGGAAGYVFRHLSAQENAAEQAKQIAKLEHIRKTAGERVAQMRDQIMGLTKTVEELRQVQSKFEAEKRRREMVDRALEQSPFERPQAPAQEDGDKKGPPSVFADTQVMDK
jgi:TolA-binding protein